MPVVAGVETSQRDPVPSQVVWFNYGQRAINNVNNKTFLQYKVKYANWFLLSRFLHSNKEIRCQNNKEEEGMHKHFIDFMSSKIQFEVDDMQQHQPGNTRPLLDIVLICRSCIVLYHIGLAGIGWCRFCSLYSAAVSIVLHCILPCCIVFVAHCIVLQSYCIVLL